jgi:hypothetical protein
MTGVIGLVDGRWVLKDDADAIYLLPYPGESAALLDEALFRPGADASLPYAEPGMTGVIGLVDGRWVLKDDADAIYLLPYPSDFAYMLDEPDFRLYPGMRVTIIVVDGRLALKDDADVRYPLPYPLDLAYMLPESGFRESAEAAADYAEPDERLKFHLTENADILRKIYNTIVKLEAGPDRPPEVIVDLGPVREDQRQGLFLSPESPAKTESGGKNAILLFVKNLTGGKYYLQIGLFDQKEVLARKLATLNWIYPYALETSESRQSPKYKLLVGPVNEGESNALLLRFKRYGYHDAFIRREG